MNLYPVNLRIENKSCIIVGGGEVATRKARELLACGARVKVISPRVSAELQHWENNEIIEILCKEYQDGDLGGAYLVFAATDKREVQNAIVAEAHRRNILINCVDDPSICSFHVPAMVRRGDLLLTVSTGGSSPALAAKLRRQLEQEFGDEYSKFIELLGKIRRQIVTTGDNHKEHKALFEKLLQLNILDQIRSEDWSALQEDLRTILPKEIDIGDLIDLIDQTDRSSGEI